MEKEELIACYNKANEIYQSTTYLYNEYIKSRIEMTQEEYKELLTNIGDSGLLVAKFRKALIDEYQDVRFD